jgi:hypothetical protein
MPLPVSICRRPSDPVAEDVADPATADVTVLDVTPAVGCVWEPRDDALALAEVADGGGNSTVLPAVTEDAEMVESSAMAVELTTLVRNAPVLVGTTPQAPVTSRKHRFAGIYFSAWWKG